MSSDVAPGGLGLVQAFVNSVELPDGPDELGDPPGAATWIRQHGVAVTDVPPADHRRLIEVREALRDLLEAHTGNNVPGEPRVRLQKLLGKAALSPVVDAFGPGLVPVRASGVDGFLGQISAAIVEAGYRGTWERLKVCRSDTCRFAFYDTSKNTRAHWCSMRTCGTREKARSYRARKKGSETA